MILAFLAAANIAAAQESIETTTIVNDAHYTRNGILNHLDAAFTVGTTGFGFDLAVPVTDWVRLRAGGAFQLARHYSAAMDAEIAQGQTEEVQAERFSKLSSLMTSFMGMAPTRTIELEGDMQMSQVKVLVDIYPFKNNRHWRATVGFFYGGNTLIDGSNTGESVNTTAAISSYNKMYDEAKNGTFPDMSTIGIQLDDAAEQMIINKMRSWGEYTDADGNQAYAEYGISMPVGTYAHDMVAAQDIYDKSGNLVHRKGDVIRRTGETVRALPDDHDMIRCNVHVNRFKPYLGIGYETAVSKDRRSTIGIDAGVLFWGGSPTVDMQLPVGRDADGNEVLQTIDLVRDADNVPGKLGDYVKTAKNYTVYPEISVRFARRLW